MFVSEVHTSRLLYIRFYILVIDQLNAQILVL